MEQSQAMADAEVMVGPIRDLMNEHGLTNAQALLALSITFDSILASTRGVPTQPEVMEAIHDTLRKLCEATSVDAVLDSTSHFLVDSARAVLLVNDPDGTA